MTVVDNRIKQKWQRGTRVYTPPLPPSPGVSRSRLKQFMVYCRRRASAYCLIRRPGRSEKLSAGVPPVGRTANGAELGLDVRDLIRDRQGLRRPRPDRGRSCTRGRSLVCTLRFLSMIRRSALHRWSLTNPRPGNTVAAAAAAVSLET
jgi:hypothetical protein